MKILGQDSSTMGPDDWFGFFFFLAIVTVVMFALGALTMTVLADGRVDYCGIEVAPGGSVLRGHRPWRPDAEIARATTTEELTRIAAQIGCPLDTAPVTASPTDPDAGGVRLSVKASVRTSTLSR